MSAGTKLIVAGILAAITWVIYFGVYLFLHKGLGMDPYLSVGASIIAAIWFMVPKGMR